MTKRIVWALLAVFALLGVTVGNAYAAGVSADEQRVLNELERVVTYWNDTCVQTSHANQYLTEAETAMLGVDLSPAACDELVRVVRDVDALFGRYDCKTREDLVAHAVEACAILGSTDPALVRLKVTVDPQSMYAKATWTVPSKEGNKTTVLFDTRDVVRQTDVSPLVRREQVSWFTAGCVGSVAVLFGVARAFERRY